MQLLHRPRPNVNIGRDYCAHTNTSERRFQSVRCNFQDFRDIGYTKVKTAMNDNGICTFSVYTQCAYNAKQSSLLPHTEFIIW